MAGVPIAVDYQTGIALLDKRGVQIAGKAVPQRFDSNIKSDVPIEVSWSKAEVI